MNWTDNKTLLEYTQYTSCQDIFQAVCNEIGKHYQNIGFKYSHSRPKLIIENEKLKLEICFWSSRSNMSGESVGLEILPSFYSKQLKNGRKIKVFLFGHTGIFYHKYKDDKSQIRVNQIFGDILDRIDEYTHESEMIDNNYCNVFGLDKEKFDKIITFIDTKILQWFTKIQTEEGILEFLQNANSTRISAIYGNGFIEYIHLNFPNIDIESELKRESTHTVINKVQ